MQLSDAVKIAETVAADAEAQGFTNTAEAMRSVLREMALCESVAVATSLPAKSLSLS